MIEKLNQHFSFTNPASIHDEEALTALELAGRQGKKINEIVGDQNALRTETEAEIKHMKEVQIPNEVEDEFKENLDNGTFEDMVDEYAGDLKNRVDTLSRGLTEGSTTMDAEVIDLRSDLTMDYRTSDVPLTHGTARSAFIQAFNYVPFAHGAIMNGSHNLNHWHWTQVGVYSFAGDTVAVSPLPEGMEGLPQSGSGNDSVLYVKVEATDRYRVEEAGFIPRGVQTVFTLGYEKVYQRFFKCTDPVALTYEFDPWRPANVSDTFRTITVDCDLNGIVEEDRYIIATTGCDNNPAYGYGGLLFVSKLSHGWIVQEYFGLHNNSFHFWRVGNCPSQTRVNHASDLSITWGEWNEYASTKAVQDMIDRAIENLPTGGGGSGEKPLAGKVVVNMGDSIFGNFRDSTSISAQLAKLTGATVHNFAFGGTRAYSRGRGEPWGYFDFDQLVNSILSENWAMQRECLNYEEVPDYFAGLLDEIEAFDFSTVDILTLAFGTNDFSAGLMELADFGETVANYYAQSVIKLNQRYPNMKIVVVTPCYRDDMITDGGDYYGAYPEADDCTRFHGYIKQFHDTDVFANTCMTIVDPAFECGINHYNADLWFSETDRVHPNGRGRLDLAKVIADKIKNL